MAVLGILLTSIVIGGTSAYLLYRAHSAHLAEQLGSALTLQAATIDAEIKQLQNTAKQVTSRTRIRQELERYQRGLISGEALAEFSAPKMDDARRANKAILGITRIGARQEILVQVGAEIPETLMPGNFSVPGPILGTPDNGLILVAAPIRDSSQRTIGHDLVLYDDRRLREIMSEFPVEASDGTLQVARMRRGQPVVFYTRGKTLPPIDEETIKAHLIESIRLGAARGLHALGEGHDSRIIAKQQIGDTGWVLVFHADTPAFFATARNHALIVLSLIVTLTILGILLTRRAIQPLVLRESAEARNLQRLLKQNEELLKEVTAKEAKLQSVIDNAPAVIYIKDTNGKYLLVNSSYERLVHLPREQIINKYDYQLFPEDTAKSTRDTDLEVLATQRAITVDEHLNRSDGRHDFLSIKFPLFDTSGKAYGVCGISTDITERKHVEKRLALTQSTVDSATFGVFWARSNGKLIYANETALRQAQIAREHLGDMHFVQLFPSLGETGWAEHWDHLQSAGSASYQVRQQRLDGSDFPAEIHAFFLSRDDDDYCIAVVHDISERHAAETKLRQSATVFESTTEAIIITDQAGHVLDVNPAFTEMLGYERNEVLGQNPSLWRSEIHDRAFYHELWASLNDTGQWRGEIMNRHKDGSIIPELVSINTVYDESHQAINHVAICTDIRQIKESQERLAYLAHHDALTHLPNRMLFQERVRHSLDRAARRQSHVGIIFVDLDHFKDVNDSLGHSAGDHLLKAVADLLRSVLRKDDTVARIGGDEFTILIEDVSNRDHLSGVIEKILDAFDCEFDLGDAKIRVSPSLGICVSPDDGVDADTLMRNADAAMYRAKSLGRNTYQFYTEELTRIASQRMQIDSALRKAVTNREFRLQYQPQIDLQNGGIIGMEALLRWQSDELGFVPPDQFIPIAENNGLIIPVGAWVLREACQQGKRWLDNHQSFGKLAVNISGIQVRRGDLAETVDGILKETGFPAEHLELEVTEGFIMGETKHAVETLTELRELGVTLAVDDFGTGYSSLAYLKSLPIHRLKIDKSFIHDIPRDQDDVAITRAVIALGKSLGLELVAEGVETDVQRRFLQDEGCQCAQGYLFHHPVDSTDMGMLLENSCHSGPADEAASAWV